MKCSFCILLSDICNVAKCFSIISLSVTRTLSIITLVNDYHDVSEAAFETWLLLNIVKMEKVLFNEYTWYYSCQAIVRNICYNQNAFHQKWFVYIQYRVLILCGACCFTTSAINPPCTWAVSWMGFVNTVNKPTESGSS